MSDPLLIEELANIRQVIPLGSTWRHRRGEVYYIVGHCILDDRVPGVLCRGQDAIVWCRPSDQFFDGRLICIDGGISRSREKTRFAAFH